MKVVVDSLAWLEKSKLSEDNLRNLRTALTIFPKKTSSHPSSDDPDPIYLYEDRDDQFGVPREFFRQKASKQNEVTVNVSDGVPMNGFGTKMRFEGSYEEQSTALEAMAEYDNGIDWGGQLLQGKCGFGKTNCGLEYARRRGRRTLIIVHKTMFLRQWRERIEEFMPEATVGIIQADVCETDCDFVIAMVHSLVNHVAAVKNGDPTKYPKNVFDGFGTVLIDECHRIGASTWSEVMKFIPARYRVGLTATPRRKDGAEDVFRMHIGPIVYKAHSQPIVPKLRKLATIAELQDVEGWQKIDGDWHRHKTSKDNLILSQIETQLSNNEFRTRQIAEVIVGAAADQRKSLVISSRIEHLWDLKNEIAKLNPNLTVDAYTGSWFVLDEHGNRTVKKIKGKLEPKTKTRTEEELEQAEKAQVVLATKQMVEEGLDIPAVDALFLTMPMSDIEQAVGRCQRECLPRASKCERLCSWRSGVCTGKPIPVVIDVVDESITQLQRKWNDRRNFYQSIGVQSA